MNRIFLAVVVWLIVSSPLRTAAQETPKATDFTIALRRIARQGKVAIIVEAMPLRASLPETDVPVWNPGDSVKSNLKRLAEAYDFSLSPVKNTQNVFCLRKRYSDVHDLPAITLQESYAAMEDIARLLAQHTAMNKSGGQPGDEIPQMYAHLTESERAALERNELRVRDLSPEQRERLTHTALNLYIGLPSIRADGLTSVLQQVPKSSIEVRKVQGINLLGFLWRNRIGAAFYILSDTESLEAAKEGGGSMASDASKEANPPIERTTLLAAVTALMHRSAMKSLIVSPEVMERPIVRFGEEFATPEELIAAYAESQGLRLATRPDKSFILKRRSVPQSAKLLELAATVRAALPELLARALHEPEIAALQYQLDHFPPAPTALTAEQIQNLIKQGRLGKPDEKLEALAKRKDELESAGAKVSAEAKRFLYAAFLRERNAYGKDSKSVPVALLKPQERSALALCMLSSFLYLMQTDIPAQIPDYIRRFDELSLGGGIQEEKGKRLAHISFNLYHEDEKEMRMETMISNIFMP